ncbi:helix-turn-helix domain-containing protein [Thiocapsa sp. UBA6158]|uniref:helix-turn-helix domain-containing protein n=1 Tax=Thiocapsa sp. UBA6158 TaxID=1947692 RepID=UPI0025EA01D4|nr:helix-turn-helix transcriptional regulator [Thiocapsa sp. UBA6158]
MPRIRRRETGPTARRLRPSERRRHRAHPAHCTAAHAERLIDAYRVFFEFVGLTQADVAARAGMSQAALSQSESGAHKARKATKAKLAAALGITVIR